jgi:hypothetical protein
MSRVKECTATAPLYERLLGSAWLHVSEPVRKIHSGCGDVRARGAFCIRHGSNRLSRIIAWFLRLPIPADAAPVHLQTVQLHEGERWTRTIGMRRMVTVQQEATGRMLAERYGLLEFQFQLEPAGGALRYIQRRVAIRLWRLRLAIPGWLAPQVSAEERAADAAGRTHVSVKICVSLVGLLISYEGELELEEPL